MENLERSILQEQLDLSNDEMEGLKQVPGYLEIVGIALKLGISWYQAESVYYERRVRKSETARIYNSGSNFQETAKLVKKLRS